MGKLIKTADYNGPCRRFSNGRNGLVQWMLGIAVASLMGWTGWGWASIQQKFQSYDSLALARGERLASLETNWKGIDRRLENIERKLDQLMAARK